MEEEPPRDISETDLHALLTQRRRRLALRVLQRVSTPPTAIELARNVAEREHEDPSDETLRAVHISLYHSHLPKLEDAGVITYDEDDGTVRRGPNFATLLAQIEAEGDLPESRSDP